MTTDPSPSDPTPPDAGLILPHIPLHGRVAFDAESPVLGARASVAVMPHYVRVDVVLTPSTTPQRVVDALFRPTQGASRADADAIGETLSATAAALAACTSEAGFTVPDTMPLPRRVTAAFQEMLARERQQDRVESELRAKVAEVEELRDNAVEALRQCNSALTAEKARTVAWENTASERDQSAAYYRGIVDRVAEALGPEAYTADDGTVMQDPVRPKVAELVAARLANVAELARDAARKADAECEELRAEVSELRAALADIRAAVSGAPGVPDQLLGDAVRRALSISTPPAVELTAAVYASEKGTFLDGAKATQKAAADLAFDRPESTADDIGRAILRMELPAPRESSTPAVEPETTETAEAVAPTVPPPPHESVGADAAADTPAVYNVAAAAKGLSPWTTPEAANKPVRQPPPPPVQPLDAPPAPETPEAAPLTDAEEALVERIAGMRFLKDVVLAAAEVFPEWDAARVVAFFEAVRPRVTMLRRVPAAALPDRVRTHFAILGR